MGDERARDGPVAFSGLPAGEMALLRPAPLWWRRPAPMVVSA
ncbi:hypothetical protein ACGFJ7_29265 [Actinoplanes sp. NPDC048988]